MKVFADTFFYLALFNSRDENHRRIVQWAETSDAEVVTTQWVLTEVADAFSGSRLRGAIQGHFSELAADPGTRIIEVSALDFDRGLSLYTERPDKTWSLTDCISFTIMSREGLTEALTGDHHFEQAGFRALFGKS